MRTNRRSIASLAAIPALAVLQAIVEAQGGSAGRAAPRTPWGDPDLQGTYTSDNSIGVPLARPPQYGTRAELTPEEFAAREKANAEQIAKDQNELPESRLVKDDAPNNAPRHWLERAVSPSRATSLIVDPPDGRVPAMTPEGQKRAADRQAAQKRRGGAPASYADFTNYDRCITRGVTGSILPVIYGNGTSILQAPGFVVISNEMIHEARVVPLDGRPRTGSGVQMYMGDSRGRWEGDTLVVESANFTDRTGIGGNDNGNLHSEDLRLVERFTRVDANTVRYEFTVDDPKIYTRPWTVRVNLAAKPGYEIYEYACHEGNYGLRNMLSAARAEEK
jgi:hypothetical protein